MYPSLNPLNLFLFVAGGKKFCTTIDTLTQREPDSMLAAMFSGRHTVCRDPENVHTTCAVTHFLHFSCHLSIMLLAIFWLVVLQLFMMIIALHNQKRCHL